MCVCVCGMSVRVISASLGSTYVMSECVSFPSLLPPFSSLPLFFTSLNVFCALSSYKHLPVDGPLHSFMSVCVCVCVCDAL